MAYLFQFAVVQQHRFVAVDLGRGNGLHPQQRDLGCGGIHRLQEVPEADAARAVVYQYASRASTSQRTGKSSICKLCVGKWNGGELQCA